MFYALSANGIDIINPVDLTIEKRLPYNTPIPGTSQVLCTYCPRHRSQCSWGGAATVKGKYVFAADANGNRVIVIDITTQQPIKSIPTDGFPYQVTYIAALDEVWVFCWKDSKLNVVGSSTMETKIHRISQASNLMIVKSIKAQVYLDNHSLITCIINIINIIIIIIIIIISITIIIIVIIIIIIITENQMLTVYVVIVSHTLSRRLQIHMNTLCMVIYKQKIAKM